MPHLGELTWWGFLLNLTKLKVNWQNILDGVVIVIFFNNRSVLHIVDNTWHQQFLTWLQVMICNQKSLQFKLFLLFLWSTLISLTPLGNILITSFDWYKNQILDWLLYLFLQNSSKINENSRFSKRRFFHIFLFKINNLSLLLHLLRSIISRRGPLSYPIYPQQ